MLLIGGRAAKIKTAFGKALGTTTVANTPPGTYHSVPLGVLLHVYVSVDVLAGAQIGEYRIGSRGVR